MSNIVLIPLVFAVFVAVWTYVKSGRLPDAATHKKLRAIISIAAGAIIFVVIVQLMVTMVMLIQVAVALAGVAVVAAIVFAIKRMTRR